MGHMYTVLHGKRGEAKETEAYMGRGEGPKRGHMYTGLHRKRREAKHPWVTCTQVHIGRGGGAKEGSHVHRFTWVEGRDQRGVTCT